MGSTIEFKSKKQQEHEALVSDVLNGQGAVIVFLKSNDEGEKFLSEVLIKLTPAEAVVLLEQSMRNISDLALSVLASEDE